jgi:hypothetical protein
MRRREFISGLGSAAGWPLVARAQQNGRSRRVAVLMPNIETDSSAQEMIAAFRQGLSQFGWLARFSHTNRRIGAAAFATMAEPESLD